MQAWTTCAQRCTTELAPNSRRSRLIVRRIGRWRRLLDLRVQSEAIANPAFGETDLGRIVEIQECELHRSYSKALPEQRSIHQVPTISILRIWRKQAIRQMRQQAPPTARRHPFGAETGRPFTTCCTCKYQVVAARNVATTREISTLCPGRSATRANFGLPRFSEDRTPHSFGPTLMVWPLVRVTASGVLLLCMHKLEREPMIDIEIRGDIA